MKKLLLTILLLLSMFVTAGCKKDNPPATQTKVFELTLINSENLLVNSLNSTYEVNTRVVVTTNVVLDANLNIYLNGVKINQINYDAPHWQYEFFMPNKNSTLEFKVESDNPLYGDTISNYVTFNNITIPVDYFTCEMSEVEKAEAFDLSTIKKDNMIGEIYSSSFEFGRIINANLPNLTSNYSYYEINKIENNNTINTSYYYDNKTKQYEQLLNEKGYGLNETNSSLSVYEFAVDGQNNSNVVDYTPNKIALLNNDGSSVTYKQG